MPIPFYFTDSTEDRLLLFGETMFERSWYDSVFWRFRSLTEDLGSPVLNDGWARFAHVSQSEEPGFLILFVPHGRMLDCLYPFSLLTPTLIDRVLRGRLKLLVWFTHEFLPGGPPQLRSVLRRMSEHMRAWGIDRIPGSVTVLHGIKNFGDFSLTGHCHAIRLCYIDWFTHALRVQIEKCSVAEPLAGKRERLYLMFNRRTRTHRLLAVQWLAMHGLLEEGLVSFFEPNGEIDVCKMPNPCGKLLAYMNANKPPVLEIDSSSMEDYLFANTNIEPYQKSYFSIVTETCFLEDQLFVTEKTYKPIANGHPYLIIGPTGILAHLREQGYQTYPEIFDESYDDMMPSGTKIETVLNNVRKYASLTSGERASLLAHPDIAEKARFNQQHFLRQARAAELETFFKALLTEQADPTSGAAK
jgi:hypothetical protein